MKNNIFLVSIIILVCLGCSYNFPSDHFLNIEKPSTKNNSIIINDFNNGDTINVERVMTFTVEGPSNPNQAESKVYLDGELIGSAWNNGIGTFKLYPSRYEDGTHTLKFQHSFFSGSGSIADQIGEEVLTKVEQFEFIVRRKTTTPPPITVAKVENGSITLNWEKINGDDYENAFLSIKFKESEQRIPLTKDMLNSKEFIDRTTVLFTGSKNTPYYDFYSKATYSILLTNEFTENYGDPKSIVYNPQWVVPKISFKDLKSYNLNWSQHPMYSNFENFQINVGTQQTSFTSFNGTSKGGEHTINHPYVFGSQYYTYIKPNDTYRTHEFYRFNETELDNNTFGLFNFDGLISNGIVYHPSNDKFYAAIFEDYTSSSQNANLFIYEYSNDMEIIQKKFVLNIPYSERYQSLHIDPITENFYIETPYSCYLIDKTNFSIIKQEIGNHENGIRKTFRGDIAIIRNGYFPTNTTVKNLETNNILYSGDTTTVVLSDGGNYIYIGNQNSHAIYEIIEGQLFKIIDLNEYVYQLIVYGNTLIYSHSENFTVVNLNTMNKKTYNFGTYQKVMQFDPISNKLLLINNGIAGVYDLSSDDFTTFPYEHNKFNAFERNYFMYLQNGRLFHSKGIYVDNF